MTLPPDPAQPQFALQFPIELVGSYAARFAYEDDVEVLAMGRSARARSRYTRDEFVAVCRWKTVRSTPLVARNTAEDVEAATTVALAGATPEPARMRALRSLRGVDWPTASVLLHLACPDRYPILDVRALHALGVRRPAAYSLRFWTAYRTAWLAVRECAGVDGRTLDRGLWQWSKEHEL